MPFYLFQSLRFLGVSSLSCGIFIALYVLFMVLKSLHNDHGSSCETNKQGITN